MNHPLQSDLSQAPVLVPPDVRYESAFRRLYSDYLSANAAEWCDNAKPALADFASYVRNLEEESQGIGIDAEWSATSHFWLKVGDHLAGTLRIRHCLTPAVRERAGHLGYDIAPSFRRRQLGHEILRLALIETGKFGIADVLAICDETNTASRRILESRGAVIEKRHGGEIWYWLLHPRANG